ncbi:hypothetical protein SDC9_143552 [bioreactor metagenome]|uniref:Uncharacterized protein n=1 Tax=bioreactor metagenome TaxID=1076179 RepID=A0A645E4C7_9ZZZZ
MTEFSPHRPRISGRIACYVVLSVFTTNFDGGLWGGIRRLMKPWEQALFFLLGAAALGLWGSMMWSLGKARRKEAFVWVMALALFSPVFYLWDILWRPLNETAYRLLTFGRAPYLVVFGLQFVFCTPVLGIVRLIPPLTQRVESILLLDPLICAVTGLIYAVISIVCYQLGSKAQNATPPDALAEETEDIPQE